MKTLFLISFTFFSNLISAQNVKIEIFDISRKMEGKEYSTFQCVNASYSAGRSTIVFITNKEDIAGISYKLPKIFSRKQEYTDVWVLGINLDDKNNLTDIDEKIIDLFFDKIIKYRFDNDLLPYTKERLKEQVIYLDNKESFCKYLICP